MFFFVARCGPSLRWRRGRVRFKRTTNCECKTYRAPKINVKENSKKIPSMTIRCFVVGCFFGCDGTDTHGFRIGKGLPSPWREHITAAGAGTATVTACCYFYDMYENLYECFILLLQSCSQSYVYAY